MEDLELHKTPAGMIATESTEKVLAKEKGLYTSYRALWFLLMIIEVLLVFRFILKLFGANPGNFFTGLIYMLSFFFYWPFATMFGRMHVLGESYLEWPILIAIIFYPILIFLAVKAIGFGKPTNVKKVERVVNRSP